MRRRIILILTIVVAVCVIAGGAWLYLRRHSKPRMRAQIAVEVQAKHFDRAASLASEYIQRYPDDWRGYYARADALVRQGRYDEARQDLQTLLSDPQRFDAADKVSVAILLSNTHALPARRVVDSENPSLEALADSIQQIVRANKMLSELAATSQLAGEGKGLLNVTETIGINQVKLGTAHLKRAFRLAKEAEIAKAAGSESLRQTQEKESLSESADAQTAKVEAVKTLLEVVKADPSRQESTRTLVALCVDIGDQESLAAAQEAILGLKSPPPLATLMLIRHQLQTSRRSGDAEEYRKKAQAAAGKLDEILAQPDLRPDELTQVRLGRAELALEMKDFPTVDRLVNGGILQANPRQGEARFLRAKLLLEQGNLEQAEQELFLLKTDFPRFIGAHLLYAQAAERSGKTDMVREAMRAVTKVEPRNAMERGYVASAWRYLVASLLREGVVNQAFLDAQEYYRQSPDDPVAVRLFADAALRSNQGYLAKETLAKAAKDHPADPVMLMAVCEGYEMSGDKAAARDAAAKAAECKSDSREARVAVARALTMLGRMGEAEKLLSAELAMDWRQPAVHFILAQVYWSTGRQMQALEQYRAAVQLEDQNEEYKVALARRLFEMGDLDACQTVLDQSDRADPDVKLLAARIRLIRGEQAGEETVLETPGGGAVSVALDYLRTGRPDKAVEVCLNELKPDKAPDNLDARSVLAGAYAALGQQEKSVEQLTEVVKAAPNQMPGYLALAVTLLRNRPLDEAIATVSKVPGARRDLVDMTAGWLYARFGLNDRAAEAFTRVVDNKGARDYSRWLARLYRAVALARSGNAQAAMTDLDALAAQESWRKQALLAKAELLLSLRRTEEARPILSQMRSLAIEVRDMQWLTGLATLYTQMAAFDAALAVCDDIIKLQGGDPRSYLAKAAVLERAGKAGEAIEAYKQVVALQPGSFDGYARLARACDAQGQPLDALATLEQLATVSKLGQEAALWEKGNLLAGWGLSAEAANCFQRLAETGKFGAPQIQLALGRAFARLGRKDAAKTALEKIPPYAQSYIAAQELLAQIADTKDAKLPIIRNARKVKPDAENLLTMEMTVLMQAGKPADAVAVYRDFVKAQPAGRTLAIDTHCLAVQAMLQSGQKKEAAELCRQQAEQTHLARWRQTAALLLIEEDPAAAAKMLGEPSEAGFIDAVLGVVLSSRTGDDARCGQWVAQLERIEQGLAQQGASAAVAPSYGLLALLATGKQQEATEKLGKLSGMEPVSASVAEAMMVRAKSGTGDRAQAAGLLKATVAGDLGLLEQSRAWAMDLLRADPYCQWAAMLIVQRTAPDDKAVQAVMDLLQPKDCLLAQTIAASVMVRRKEYDRAYEIYGKLAATEANNSAFLLYQASAAESAGRLSEALELYRKVYQSGKNPAAANNAACIITQLWPKDPDKLAEAQTMIEAALKAQPQVASIRDTFGWVALLQGRTEDALRNLRQAIKDLPDAPEAHYHLGVAEAAVKQDQLARWHLAAAVELGRNPAIGGDSPSASSAAKSAQEMLNQMGPAEK
jgi:tetratricopeptide (TPR) repeat protein